jgi:hypothetical protein
MAPRENRLPPSPTQSLSPNRDALERARRSSFQRRSEKLNYGYHYKLCVITKSADTAQSVVAEMLHGRLRFPTEESVYGAHAPGISSPEIKQLQCEAGHALLPNAQDKNGPTRQRPPKAMGFVRCNIANNDSVSLYPTLCTLVLGGGGYLLLGMILKHFFGKSVYWVLCTKENIQILLIRLMRITHKKDSLNAAINSKFS